MGLCGASDGDTLSIASTNGRTATVSGAEILAALAAQAPGLTQVRQTQAINAIVSQLKTSLNDPVLTAANINLNVDWTTGNTRMTIEFNG